MSEFESVHREIDRMALAVLERLAEKNLPIADPVDSNNYTYIFHAEHTGADTVTLYIISSSIPPLVYNLNKESAVEIVPRCVRDEPESPKIYALDLTLSSLLPDSRFSVQRGTGYKRIIQPYCNTFSLPEGFSFSAYRLFLNWQSPVPSNDLRQRAFIREIAQQKDQTLIFRGVLITNYPVEADVVLTIRKFREEEFNASFPVTLRRASAVWGVPEVAYKYRQEYAYKFDIPVKMRWSKLPSSLYGVILHVGDESTGLRQFNSTFSSRTNLFGLGDVTVCAHIDKMAEILRFEKYSIPFSSWPELYEYRRPKRKRAVCLLGEYTNAARDNAWYLFNHLKQSEGVTPYYIIEKGCGISGEGVVEWGSMRHVRRCLDADVVAFTHHPTYVVPHFPLRIRNGKMPKTIFLQHGVTALKNSMEAYHVSKRRFDRFVVCSEREADDVAKACEYPRDRMLVSGFPRYDSLLKLVEDGGGGFENIVIFPTWRRGLDKKTHEEFLQSEFYACWYRAFEQLRQVADQVGARIQLVSHPIIERHIHAFTALVDEVVEVERIQDVIVNAGCLITDYSSIAFDALYAGRRSFFYTFDAEEFGFKEGAFVDVDTQLPGTRVATAEELAEAVLREWPLRHSLDQRTVELAPLYFAHFDRDNSNRIEQEIKILAGKIDPAVMTETGDIAIAEDADQSSESDAESETGLGDDEAAAEDQTELQDDELDDLARSDGTLEDNTAEE